MLGIVRVLVIVDRAPVKQSALGVDQEHPRSLLGEPSYSHLAAGIAEDGKREPAVGHRLEHLLHRFTLAGGNRYQPQLRMPLHKAVKILVVANAVRAEPGPENNDGSLLATRVAREALLGACNIAQREIIED